VKNHLPKSNFIKVVLLALALLLLPFHFDVKAQEENTEKPNHFRGNISITQNGLSLIPTFSLDRPAAIFELSMGGKRVSFDPEMRFALDGQPWSFIFWWRYKIIRSEKFKLHAGAHPAFIFRNTIVMNANGQPIPSMEARRFFAGELVPSYTFNPHFSTGFLYLRGQSLGKVPLEVNQFVAANATFTNIKISEKYFFNARPQAFYLKMNERDGFYASSSLLLGRYNMPFSLGSIISRKITSDIPSKDWVWNVSLIYSFNNEFVKRVNPLL
jgi:hypothetical protein